ncbi:methyltransferase family protein [Mesocricetibacter intestinalis]|uniref:Methyltransferase family protein n=1 Tax=Mesocricetibacter intestinalis TaxID=1521930 RepID=A0A4R6VC11_9PAST|nr:class I SAM-dependent methyltransferase [Mesocricetibacter intestinalis]TDQ59838.1 methyltransferase family protein [Mesocricetibacter intestinalis]
MSNFIFSKDWFSHNIPPLTNIFSHIQPKTILEVGSFEGRSTVFFAELARKFQSSVQICCVDTWQGSVEHSHINMAEAEQRFLHNVSLISQQIANIEILQFKQSSHQAMIDLLARGYANYFDFIYIDGSHEAPDVLFDALLAHRLCKIGGIIAFDDYLWSPNRPTQDDHYLLVKPAVDHYVNTYQRKLQVIQMQQLYQLYVKKLAD